MSNQEPLERLLEGMRKLELKAEKLSKTYQQASPSGQRFDLQMNLDRARLAVRIACCLIDDAQAIIDLVRKTGGTAHIPTQRDRKRQRSVDRMLYRQRNLVERFFCKLKHFRGVATRFAKLARNFLAAVLLASTRLWIRAYESTT